MASERVHIRFVAGSRVLCAVPRNLQTVAYSLAEAVDGAVGGSGRTLPALEHEAHGYRLLSIPVAQMPDMLHARPDMIVGGVQTYARHYVDMAGGFASYMDRFSSKTRATLRRKRRKLMADIGGTATFREFRTPAEMDAFRDLAMPLSQRTYQARSLDAGLPTGSAAHEQRRRLAAQDRVRAFLLCRDERAVSYLYLPINGDTVQYAYLGYDPEFARFSPGTVLQLEAMERLFAEDRYRHFDFTEGDGAHKAMFGTHSVECASLFLLRRTMAHRALLGGVDTFDAAIAHAKGRMQGSSALPAIRRMLRTG